MVGPFGRGQGCLVAPFEFVSGLARLPGEVSRPERTQGNKARPIPGASPAPRPLPPTSWRSRGVLVRSGRRRGHSGPHSANRTAPPPHPATTQTLVTPYSHPAFDSRTSAAGTKQNRTVFGVNARPHLPRRCRAKPTRAGTKDQPGRRDTTWSPRLLRIWPRSHRVDDPWERRTASRSATSSIPWQRGRHVKALVWDMSGQWPRRPNGGPRSVQPMRPHSCNRMRRLGHVQMTAAPHSIHDIMLASSLAFDRAWHGARHPTPSLDRSSE